MGLKGKFDFDAWVSRNAARIGVREEDLRRAFAGEGRGDRPADDVLEVPDVWKATYRYSCGGTSRFFREIRDNGKLFGSRCPQCGHVFCPPRKNCSICYADTEWVSLPGTGEIRTFTKVHTGTSAVRRYPFVVAYVKLDGSDSVLCTVIEMDDDTKARVGMKVKAAFKEQRDGRITDFVFVPDEGSKEGS